MIETLHYLKDPKLWEMQHIPFMGNAGSISSTVILVIIQASIVWVWGGPSSTSFRRN